MNQPRHTFDEVLADLRVRADGPGRFLAGFAGAPGSGKSTVAARLSAALGDTAVVVPLDGFHLANRIIEGTPLAARKGAIDTFDGDGFAAMLERLAARTDAVVYAPAYERSIEEPVAGAIAIPRTARILLVEGNYLLDGAEPWRRITGILDRIWFVEPPEPLRLERLIRRHIEFGKSPEAAKAWATGPDEANAARIRASAVRADATLVLN